MTTFEKTLLWMLCRLARVIAESSSRGDREGAFVEVDEMDEEFDRVTGTSREHSS